MFSPHLALGTIGIIAIGLAAVSLILTLATLSVVNRWRRAGH